MRPFNSGFSKLKNTKNINKEKLMISFRENSINSLKLRINYELMYEAFYIANLFYDMNETSKHKNDKSFYILNRKWFESWKKYVHFDKYMYFHSKYLSINSLPIRPREAPMKEIFEKLKSNPKIRDNLYHYFNSLFLTDNSGNFPGIITNKLLLYDKKDSYFNLDNKDSNYNYNIDEKYIYGRDYLIVTRDIWKFFQCVYGGKEIRRYNLNRELYNNQFKNFSYNNNINDLKTQKGVILVEAKLKTINTIIIRSNFKSDVRNHKIIPFIVDAPKYIYVSHKFTIQKLKEKIKEMVINFRGRNSDELRLWILKDKSYLTFVDDLYQDFKKNIYSELKFPGISLDNFGLNTKIEDLGNIILKNVIIVVESKIHMGIRGEERYIFQKDNLNQKSENFKDIGSKIKEGKNLNDEVLKYKNSLYEKIFYKNTPGGYSKDNFVIKNYFKQKYQLEKISRMDEKDIKNFIEKISDYNNENNTKLKDLFIEEVYNLKENMDLIIDESELITKVEGIYSNMFEKEKKQPDLNLTMDMIMKKRKRKEFEEENNKYLSNSFRRNNNNEIIQILDSSSEEKSENENNNFPKEVGIIEKYNKNFELEIDDHEQNFFCNYCEKILDQDFIICDKCGKVKYCNIICKNKDNRFHSKNCNSES